MKKVILALAFLIVAVAATVPQFFYYNETRKAIAIRDSQEGNMIIRDRSGQAVMGVKYPANTSRWISVSRLAVGSYTATASNGVVLSFYRRP